MNKKGFTLIELITTFALAAVIVVILINVISIIRTIYSKNSVKTELYINQSNLSNAMNKKISKDNLDSYTACNDADFCYVFDFIDAEDVKLIVTENKITFGDFVYKLDNQSKVVNPSLDLEYITESDVSKNNAMIIIKIPIENELYPDMDFGINLVYPFNTRRTSL